MGENGRQLKKIYKYIIKSVETELSPSHKEWGEKETITYSDTGDECATRRVLRYSGHIAVVLKPRPVVVDVLYVNYDLCWGQVSFLC